MLPLVEPELLLRVSMLPSLCSSAGNTNTTKTVMRSRHQLPLTVAVVSNKEMDDSDERITGSLMVLELSDTQRAA
ncbi:hypothetical protein ILYODFUR_019736 [Ilyodon furcidens]|uniref:Secreted protein n=1 Tax=Ilyodon furcidens TaxID=33524 RepID=A0ABV0VG16_9TELE